MKKKWTITEEEKNQYISALENNLPALRAKAGVSQDELANIIGISRQTYCAVERKTKKMSWNTFMALIAFFDYFTPTHQTIRSLGAFPTTLINRLGGKKAPELMDLAPITGLTTEEYAAQLDEQARHAIRVVTILEYTRCLKLPADAVIRAFEGQLFTSEPTVESKKIKDTVKKIRNKKKGDD